MKEVSRSANKPSASLLLCAVSLALLVASASSVLAQIDIQCPPDVTVSNDLGLCSAVVVFPDPTVTGTNDSDLITITPPSGSTFPVGATEVLVTVSENTTNVASCSFTVTVVDAEAPVITDVAVSKVMLWPPNHKMVNVTVNYQVTDNCDSAPVSTLTVTSSETEDALGSGKTKPDWIVVDAHHVKLRAERSGKGVGRVYTITITATDKSGNSTLQDVTVVVPHDRGQGIGSQNGKGNDNGNGNGKGQNKGRALWL